METKIIKAAALKAKKGGGFELKIWFQEAPLKSKYIDNDDYQRNFNAWLSEFEIFEFKDDLQSGKFMWLTSSDYSFYREGENNLFQKALTNNGVFFKDEVLNLIGIDNNKVYLKALPKKPQPTIHILSSGKENIQIDTFTLKPGETITIVDNKATIDAKTTLNVEMPKSETVNLEFKFKPEMTMPSKTFWRYIKLAFAVGLVAGLVIGILL